MAFTTFVSDAYSRRIVGWRTAASMPTELPLDALEMALWTRACAGEDVTGVIHHSDAGSQYTAIRYSNRLTDAGAVALIGTVGDSYDNAQAESLIGLYRPSAPNGRDPGAASTTWNWPPCPRCTGSTRTGCTAASATSHRSSTRPSTTVTTPAPQQPLLGEASLH